MTPLIQQQIVRMETRAKFPYLIEITDPEGNIYRYANSDTDIEYEENGVTNTFTAGYFKITPPEKTQTGFKDAKLTISALDQVWIEKIRSTQKRSTVRFLAVIMYEEDGNKYAEPTEDVTMSLTNATWNDTTIEWNMKFDDSLDLLIPCNKATSFTYPGLF